MIELLIGGALAYVFGTVLGTASSEVAAMLAMQRQANAMKDAVEAQQKAFLARKPPTST